MRALIIDLLVVVVVVSSSSRRNRRRGIKRKKWSTGRRTWLEQSDDARSTSVFSTRTYNWELSSVNYRWVWSSSTALARLHSSLLWSLECRIGKISVVPCDMLRSLARLDLHVHQSTQSDLHQLHMWHDQTLTSAVVVLSFDASSFVSFRFVVLFCFCISL